MGLVASFHPAGSTESQATAFGICVVLGNVVFLLAM
jgi:hypothetical protein